MCQHFRAEEQHDTDTYDSEYGRDDVLVDVLTLTCLDCGAIYNEDEGWIND